MKETNGFSISGFELVIHVDARGCEETGDAWLSCTILTDR